MELLLTRICTKEEWTAGYVLRTDLSAPRFLCATLEDGWHVAKIPGRTRIPSGRHEILLRDEGELNQKYYRKHPDIHKGMLWLQDVPNYEWIYMHHGSHHEHTKGCVLVGGTIDYETGSLTRSVEYYRQIYPLISNEILNGNQVFITIEDVA